MSGGLLDNLTQAAHIVAGMGSVSFNEALEIVADAHDAYVAAIDEPTPPTTIGNITYVDFGRRDG
jgi:hypothetical protein